MDVKVFVYLTYFVFVLSWWTTKLALEQLPANHSSLSLLDFFLLFSDLRFPEVEMKEEKIMMTVTTHLLSNIS